MKNTRVVLRIAASAAATAGLVLGVSAASIAAPTSHDSGWSHVNSSKGKEGYVTPAKGKEGYVAPAKGKEGYVTPAKGKEGYGIISSLKDSGW